MIGRLGFRGRLVLIFFGFLLAFLALAVALSFLNREQRDRSVESFPIPAQAAAIVELLERTAPEDRQGVLRAVSSEQFTVAVREEGTVDQVSGTRMPAVEWLISDYLKTMPERDIQVTLQGSPGRPYLDRVRGWLDRRATAPISIAIALRGGGYAHFEIRGASTQRIFGLPSGLVVGLVGCLLAGAALIAILREARPLNALVRSVEGFSQDGQPRSIDQAGAPEIQRLIAATNLMQARIADLLKGRTMLLGAISHDLKTYVTRLRLRAEMIEEEDQRDRTVRDLEDMTALIDSALSVARGTLDTKRRESVNMVALAKEEAERRTAVEVKLVPSDLLSLTLDGDPVALRSVFANLLDNAERYATRCELTLSKEQNHIVLIVDDDGPGIPEKDRDFVFEPFARLDPSRSSTTGGSGLGLAITKQIVEAHGGHIEVGVSPLKGARFKVSLPASE